MRNNWVRVALLSILIYLSIYALNGAPNALIDWDALGYYFYLPLAFIRGDLAVTSVDQIMYVFDTYPIQSPQYQFVPQQNGTYIIKYHIGQSVLYLPFFFIGHLVTLFSDFPSDGFSKPYVLSALFGGVIYHFLAFFFIAKLLLNWFKPQVVGATIFTLFWATNALSHFSGTMLIAQGSLLFLIAVTLYIFHSYYREKKLKNAVLAGLFIGLVGISRPPDVLIVLLVLLWPWVQHKNIFKELISTIQKAPSHLLAFCAIAIAMLFIQLGYWKVAGGKWILNGYQTPDEGFDFLNPYTLEFLFSFKTGWFLYTPIMLLTCLWLVYQAVVKKNRLHASILIFTSVFIYIASSWSNYWYGGSFSQRAMIQVYAILAFPLASMIQFFLESKQIIRIVGISLIGLLMLLNIWQTAKFKYGSITRTTMTKEYYLASFFDLKPDPKKKALLAVDHDYYHSAEIKEIPVGYQLISVVNPSSPVKDLNGTEFINVSSSTFEEVCPYSHCFIKQVAAFRDEVPDNIYFVNHYIHKDDAYFYRSVLIKNRVDSIAITETDSIVWSSFINVTPVVRNTRDGYKDYLWNRGLENGQLKYIRTEVYAPMKELNNR